MIKELEGVLNKLVLLEKTSLESLKKENDVNKRLYTNSAHVHNFVTGIEGHSGKIDEQF